MGAEPRSAGTKDCPAYSTKISGDRARTARSGRGRMREGRPYWVSDPLIQEWRPARGAVLQRLDDDSQRPDAEFRKLPARPCRRPRCKGWSPEFAMANVYLAKASGMEQQDSLSSLGRRVGWIAALDRTVRVGGVSREPACTKVHCLPRVMRDDTYPN